MLFLYMYYHWRSSYQEGCWDPINWFNPTTFFCLSQAKTWISSVVHVCCGRFCVQLLFEVRGDCLFC